MSLENQIMADLKTAMLAKDERAVLTLRAIKSAIIIEKTSGAGTELSKETELKILQKLAKQRKESAEIFVQQNRQDLAEPELKEAAIIEKYLPAQLSDEEIIAVIKPLIESTGAKTAADMGKVMGAATKQLAGKAENKKVSELIKQLLAG
jgi:uncharacterized protein